MPEVPGQREMPAWERPQCRGDVGGDIGSPVPARSLSTGASPTSALAAVT